MHIRFISACFFWLNYVFIAFCLC